MSFTDLNLDREKIEDTLNTIVSAMGDKTSCNDPETTTRTSTYRYSIDDKSGMIKFHFKTNGTTTIQSKIGKEQELSKEIAEAIKNEILIDDRDSFSLLIPDVNKDDYELLCLYLKDDCSCEILDEEDTSTYHLLKVKGLNNDKITIKHYSNSNLQIQGKPISLYREILYFLTEVLDNDRIVGIQKEYYECDIDSSNLNDEFDALFSRSKDFLDDQIINIIKPTFTINKLEVELPDYTLFVFPILKGLEGYIKQLFFRKGNLVVDSKGFSEYFDDFSHSVIKTVYKEQISCEKTCNAIETSYNYLKRQRHTLFHVDGLISSTRVIEKRMEADEIIAETINIIEGTYSTIIEG